MPEQQTAGDAGGGPSGEAGAHRLTASLVLILLTACGSGGTSAPAPVPRSIAPSNGFAATTTAVQINGDGFVARVDGNGQLDTRHRAWLGDTELADVTWLDTQTLTATVPAGITPGLLPLKVQNTYGREGTLAAAFTILNIPASLSASITASRPTADVGQPVTVTFTVANGGTGAADLAVLNPSHAGPAATCGAASPATGVTLGVGQTQRYTWSCTGTAAGALALDGTLTATDVTTGASLEVAAASAAQVTVQEPAALAAAVSVDGSPQAVVVGQPLVVRVVGSNPGGASAIVSSLSLTPAEAACGAPTPALPLSVAGGESVTFTSTCAATTPGQLALAVSVRGQGANTGGVLTASASLAPVLSVQAPTALTAVIAAAPTTVPAGEATRVTLHVTNGPSLPTAHVTRVTPSATGAGDAPCTAVTARSGTLVRAGATRLFDWSCTPSQAGDLSLGGTLYFTVDGAPRTVSPFVPVAVTVTP